MKLNLTAVDSSQERILAYLLENASENLANKINSGTPFTKDNVQLINKKDLTSFMHYATEEARKLATKGASYACIDDNTVFGWAIHYFEEESIEGKLFNLDGTEYKAVKKTAPKSTSKQKSFVAPTTKVELPKPQQEQSSLCDMLESTTTEQAEIAPTIEPLQNTESKEITSTIALPTEPILDTTNIDADTGEILEDIPVDKAVLEELESTQPIKQETQTKTLSTQMEQPTFDKETMIYLATLLDNKIEIA